MVDSVDHGHQKLVAVEQLLEVGGLALCPAFEQFVRVRRGSLTELVLLLFKCARSFFDRGTADK